MQITIKEVINNGNDLKGVTINISVKEIARMDKAGLHLFGPNTPVDPVDDLPDFDDPDEKGLEDWEKELLKHPSVKVKDVVKIRCRTYGHSYSTEKLGAVKNYLATNKIEFEKGHSMSSEYVDYELTFDQLIELRGLLTKNDIGSDLIIV